MEGGQDGVDYLFDSSSSCRGDFGYITSVSSWFDLYF